MGSIVMISAVIGASLLSCVGFRLERLLGFIRIITVALLLTLSILAFYSYYPTFFEMLVKSNDIQALITLLFSTKLLYRLIGGGFGIGIAVFLQLKLPRLGDSIGTFLLFSFASASLLLLFKYSFTLPIFLIILGVVGLVALGLRFWKKDLFTIWTTALTGGVMVAYLFTQFYFLPVWLFIILAVLFSSIGLLSQRSAWKKGIVE